MKRTPPKEMADQIVNVLQKQNPDPNYVKKVLQYIREAIPVKERGPKVKRLPELLTQDELKLFYEAVWNGFNRTHVVIIKLLLFTGIRNTELINIKLDDVDLLKMRIFIRQKKGKKGRYVLFPPYFCDELYQYITIQKEKGGVYLFESNRMSKFTTRWIREIVKSYAKKAGINKRIHPKLFQQQILTYLTSKGIVPTKIQIISGHKSIESLNIYDELSLANIEKEYWDAMKDFPIQ
ncbi:MAG: site-specific integrase [Proteobacteria bacterium]|nr:site-specific integrase [Pseudomonadota bacterium]